MFAAWIIAGFAANVSSFDVVSFVVALDLALLAAAFPVAVSAAAAEPVAVALAGPAA